MAQQSARRGRKNQGFPPCHEHAVGDVVPVRELPYGPATWSHHRPDRWQHPITCQTLNKPLATEGASTDGKRTYVSERGYDGAAISCVAAHHMIGGNNPTGRIVF